MTSPTADWSNDWLWGLPLVVITVLFHVFGLLLIRERVVLRLGAACDRRCHILFSLVLGTAVLLVTVLHALEAAAWGCAYVVLGALPNFHSAMLYSLGAITAYGHADIFLAVHWQMMGALEALNGLIHPGETARAIDLDQRISVRRRLCAAVARSNSDNWGIRK